jgi:hypothetical protein
MDVRAQTQMRQSIQQPAAPAAGPIQVGDELVVTLGTAASGNGNGNGTANANNNATASSPSPQTVRGRVSEDGTIQLPRLDAFACAGLTPAQAAQVIARKYQLADGAAVVPAVNVERVLSTASAAATANRGMAEAPRGRADVSKAAAGSAGSGGSGYGGMAGAGGAYAEGRGATQGEYFGQQDRSRSNAGGYGAQPAPAPAGGVTRNETVAGVLPTPGPALNRAATAPPTTQPGGAFAGQPVVAQQQQQQQQQAPVQMAPQTQEAAGATAAADQPVDVLILVKDEEADAAAPNAAAAQPPATSSPQPFPTTGPAEAR